MKKIIYSMLLFCSLLSSAAFSQNIFLDFDGANDYISVPHNPGLAITGDITLETWFKLESTPGDWVRLIGKGAGGPRNYGLWIYPPTGRWLFQQYCSGGNLEYNTSSFTINQWYHFAAVKNGTNVKLYIDGSEVASSTSFGTAPCTSTDPLTIGYATFHTFMNGQMDEVRVWNVARTPGEISTTYNTELNGNEPGLVAYYNFNDRLCAGDNSGQLATNMATNTGAINDGTPINFALDGSESSGCASNFVCEGTACPLLIDPPISSNSAVPTLGQWGLILLTLLLLTFGTVAIRSRQLVLAGTRNSNATFRQLPFDKTLFVKILLPLSVLILAIFSIAISLFGYELTNADIPGSLIAVPLLAYLLHLLGGEES